MIKLFTKGVFRALVVSFLAAMLLSSCGGGGSCTGCATTSGELTLALSAPNQYPAGVAVTAYLTMTNTSATNATNLYYRIPDATNYTGATITVNNGVGNNPCVNIAAGQSCTFPAYIAANSHPGSFTVTATPDGGVVSGKLQGIWNSLTSDKSLQANTLYLTANIGLTSLAANTEPGANGVSFLYASVIAANQNGETLLSIVGVVNSATAGEFNTINLTDVTGKSLNFSPLSGNSGSGLANLSYGSIVTFLLRIPAGKSSYEFYAQTVKNGTVVDLGTVVHPITLVSSSQGVLIVQPTSFALSTKNNYESQVLTYSNIGNAPITGLTLPTADPLSVVGTTCGSTLAPANSVGSSCTYTVSYQAAAGSSGQGNLTATSTDGGSAVSNYTYEGLDPTTGLTVTSGSNPTFTFKTTNLLPEMSSQVTLTNTGNVAENNFTFTVPTYFSIASGTSGTPCVVTSGNVVTNTLAANGGQCTLTLTYTNSAALNPSATANLLVNYSYNGTPASQVSVGLTYSTDQITAPVITTVSPVNNATDVSPATSITVTFDVAMDPATLIPSNFELLDASNVAVTLVSPIVTNGDKTVSFATQAPLTYGATYHVKVPTPANVKSAVGGELDVSSYSNNVITTFTVPISTGGCGKVTVLNSNNTVTSCQISDQFGTLGSCASRAVADMNNPTSFMTAAGTEAYVANTGANDVLKFDSQNLSAGFFLSNVTNVTNPVSGALIENGTFMITNGNNTLTTCGYDTTNNIISGPCSGITSPVGLPTGIYDTWVPFAKTTLWFTVPSSNSVMVCPLTSGSIGTCVDSGVGATFNQPKGVYTDDYNTYALILNSGNNTVSRCDSTGNGVLSNCTATTGFSQPTGIFVDVANQKAYITNAGDNSVSVCSINASGVLSDCNRMEYGFTGPKDIVIGLCG